MIQKAGQFVTRFWLQRLSKLAETSPGIYYTFLLILAYAGYAYLMLFPMLLVFSIVFLVYTIFQASPFSWDLNSWLLAVVLVATAAVCARISFVLNAVRPEQPSGKSLDSDEFPILIDRITELVSTYGAADIHHIKLTTRFSIEIIRTPATGFPSDFTNTLLLGMPVMTCMSPLHMKLLLARQIGHMAQCRNSRSRRIIYLRTIWRIYHLHYAQTWSPDTILLRLFFSWYEPLFHVATTPALRLETFVKDRCMLDITPVKNAAEAISVFAIKKHYLKSTFWPDLNASAYKTPSPDYLPFSSMDAVLTKALDPDTAQRLLEKELNRELKPDHEMPNLRARLKAMGHEDFVAPVTKRESAAQHFFGVKLSPVLKQLDNIWYLKNKNIWAQRYRQGVEEKKRLKTLREQAAQSLLSNAEATEYLLLIEKYVDPDKALPLYKEIVKTNSMDSEVCYELGRLLLEADDESGVDALKIVMDINSERTTDCCQHIVNYMVNHGNVKEAQYYRRIIIEHQVKH